MAKPNRGPSEDTINWVKQNFWKVIKPAQQKSMLAAGFLLLGASLLLGTPASAASNDTNPPDGGSSITQELPPDGGSGVTLDTGDDSSGTSLAKADDAATAKYQSRRVMASKKKGTKGTINKKAYTVTADSSKTATVNVKLSSTKKAKASKVGSSYKIISQEQTGKTLKVTLKVKKAGKYSMNVFLKGNKTVSSTATIQVKVSAKKTSHNIGEEVSVGGYTLKLGMSEKEVETSLAKYGNPAYKGNGCQSYQSECWYYQKNGNTSSFMVEFYEGAVERIIFSSTKWSLGSLSNSTTKKSLSLDTRTINGGDSDQCTVYYYSETNGNVDFTMYFDNEKEWKGAGWYMCVLEDNSITHTGKNSLIGTTTKIKWDLSSYNVSSEFSGKKSDLPKETLIKKCQNLDNLALEKGKQEVYLFNMYRAYHGGSLVAYSEDSSQFAYINAKVRSLLNYTDHVAYFTGTFSEMVVNKTIDTERVNEWLEGWSQSFSENVGYNASGTALDDVTSCVSSTPHLETVLRNGFSMGSAIIDGYSSVEMLDASPMSDEDIAAAQKSFMEEYNLTTVSDPSQICAALYADSYSVFIYTNIYKLGTMSRSEWIDFILDKYDLRGYAGAEEYVGIQYDEDYKELCDDVYNGVWNGGVLLERGYTTAEEIQTAYLYFCDQVYNKDYNKAYLQALMKYFNCTAEDIYLKHSDITSTFSQIKGTDDEIIATVKSLASEYKMSVDVAAEFYVRSHTSWSERLANETRALFNLAPVYSN
jgi:hypothetical protein